MPIEELDKCSTRVLAGKMSEDHGCYVGVFDPLVYEPDAGVMDCYDCVRALRGDVLDEGVRVVI